MQVSIKKAKDVVRNYIKATVENNFEFNGSIMLHSSPGMGKSSIIKQLAEEFGFKLVDVRLASYDASFVNGVPYVDKETGELNWSVPDWFKELDPETPTILFFDELSNAPVATQHAAYRVLLDHEIRTGMPLPKNVIKIGAGNLKSDKTGVKELVSALKNRFVTHIEITPNVDDVVEHFIEKGVDQRVIGFLKFRPNLIYQLPTEGSNGFPTPRSWEFVNFLLKTFDPIKDISVFAGSIGEGPASEFSAFCAYQPPDVEKVMEGDMSEVQRVAEGDPGLQYATATAFALKAAQNLNNKGKNLSKFIQQIPNKEVHVIYAKIMYNAVDKGKVGRLFDIWGEDLWKPIAKIFRGEFELVKDKE